MTLRSIFHHHRLCDTLTMPAGADVATSSSRAPTDAVRALVADVRYELVPMASVENAIEALPSGAPVSVTCSPAKGIEATLDLTARLVDLGHDAVPHLSARMVEGAGHVQRIARWLRQHHGREVFVIAGDAAQPHGPYVDSASFLRDLLACDTTLERVGLPAYPDGHPLIETAALSAALHEKQALIEAAGLRPSATTQMCFDTARIRGWLAAERAVGMSMPIDLGVPGVVDRARLMSMGVRLGVGASLRFLRKNRAMLKLVAPGGYDPTALIAELADDAQTLGIEGIHSFTFNSVADTAAWQSAVLSP